MMCDLCKNVRIFWLFAITTLALNVAHAQTDFYDQGMKSYRSKAYDKAAYYFDLAIKKSPKEDKLFFMKGKCKVELEQYNEALDNFTQA